MSEERSPLTFSLSSSSSCCHYLHTYECMEGSHPTTPPVKCMKHAVAHHPMHILPGTVLLCPGLPNVSLINQSFLCLHKEFGIVPRHCSVEIATRYFDADWGFFAT